ncbi:putative RNA-directed DNA polymerase from transposon X-element [Trichonephila clavipes]|nr:putative RNA-directed DNA polymerase from transposon X-element [Trichonephila clavipes]
MLAPSTSQPTITPAPSKDASINAGLLKDLLVLIEECPSIDKQVFCRAFKNSLSALRAASADVDKTSDHNPVILEINLNTSIIKNPEQLSTNWNNFKFALTKKPISTLDLTSNENIERTISELNQNFSEAFVEASKPKFKNTPKILSPEIKSKIHQRNKLRKIWQRTRCPSIYSEFRTRSREIAKDIKAHSCTQWEKHIEALLPVDNTLRRKSSLLRKPFRSIPPLQGALGSTAITPIEKAEVIADSLQRSRHLYAPYFSSLNVFSINDLIFWRQLSQSSYSSFQGLKDIATSIRFFADQFTT